MVGGWWLVVGGGGWWSVAGLQVFDECDGSDDFFNDRDSGSGRGGTNFDFKRKIVHDRFEGAMPVDTRDRFAGAIKIHVPTMIVTLHVGYNVYVSAGFDLKRKGEDTIFLVFTGEFGCVFILHWWWWWFA